MVDKKDSDKLKLFVASLIAEVGVEANRLRNLGLKHRMTHEYAKLEVLSKVLKKIEELEE